MNQHFQSAQRQGKSLQTEWVLRYHIYFNIRQDCLPYEPFVLWKGDEVITWLPTGEVVSDKSKLAGTKPNLYVGPVEDNWIYKIFIGAK